MTDTELQAIRETFALPHVSPPEAKVGGKTLLAEADRLRGAILAYGNHPDGFDWGVLGKLDEQEEEIARLRQSEADLRRLAGELAAFVIRYVRDEDRVSIGNDFLSGEGVKARARAAGLPD